MSAIAAPRSAHAVKRALRIESYLALAKRSALLAEELDLPRVRQKHESAARAWLQLAKLEAAPSQAQGDPQLSAQFLKRL